MIALTASLICGLSALLLGLVFTPLIIRAAHSMGLLDAPGLRKVHRTPVPRLGGLAIAVGTLLPFSITALYLHSNLFQNNAEVGSMLTLVAAAVCVFAIGLIDDIFTIPAKYKLMVLLAASIMFCGSGGVIHKITFRGQTEFELGSFAIPVTMFWIVGVMVALNFIDGLDGLAGGISAITCGVIAFGSAMGGAIPTLLLSVALFGALLAFLVFNFNPAKVFMGDCGSLFIGFVLASSSVLASQQIGTTRGIVLPALALSIPLLDSLLTMIRRGVLQRQSLFAAERGHIHHRLLDTGLHTRHVVLLMYGVTLTAAIAGIVTYFGNAWATGLAAGGFLAAQCVLFRIAGSVRARETLSAMRRNREIASETRRYQSVFDSLLLAFREVDSFDRWWQQVCKTAERLDFAKVNLPLTRRDGSKTTLKWRAGDSLIADGDSITADVPIPQRRDGESLRMELEIGASRFLENAGQRLALFSRLMGEFGPAQLPASPNRAQAQARPEAAEYADNIVPDAATSEAARLFGNLRVAIVHDFLYTYAGAERVLEQLIVLFPKADLFSLFDFLPENMRGFIRRKPVISTFLQSMPLARRNHRAFLPLMPLAIEQLNVTQYDLVITSSYIVAKGVLTRPDQLHICYCHTPVRFAWDIQKQFLKKGLTAAAKTLAARLILHYIRTWDVRSSNNVDYFVTNSDFVGRRIEKYYRRDAKTIYPPVDTNLFTKGEEREEYYLTASRLVPYKRVDLIVEAFNRMPNRRLIVVGDGPDFAKIKAMAGPNVRAVGFQSNDRMREYMQRAKAFVFAAEEDFGIAPVEAQACGTPVIGYGVGGVNESVINGKTGLLFREQTAESLVKAVEEFETHDWDYDAVRANAERFSIAEFRQQFVELVKIQWGAFLARKLQTANSENGEATMLAWPQAARETGVTGAFPSPQT